MQEPTLSETVYSVEDGYLVVRNGSETVWRGRPHGLLVAEAFGIPGTKDALVRLEYDQGRRGRFLNVLRCRSDSAVMWAGELPPEEFPSPDFEIFDAYVSIWREGNNVGGTSWSGYRVHFEIDKGRISRLEFVK